MYPPNDVAGNGAPQGNVADKAPPKDEMVTLTKAEHESLLRQRDEARDSERYWAEQARRHAAPPADPAPESDDLDLTQFDDEDLPAGLPDDTPEKLVDDIASKGLAGLTRRGLVTAKEAHEIALKAARDVGRELIGRERTKITSDAAIMTKFPELKDSNSELFKETSKRYKAAAAMDPGALKTPAALFLAADAAQEYLSARRPARRPEDVDEDDVYETERDRRARVSAQDGRPRPGALEDADDLVGPEAMSIISQMGITQDQWKAERKNLSRPGGRTNGRR